MLAGNFCSLLRSRTVFERISTARGNSSTGHHIKCSLNDQGTNRTNWDNPQVQFGGRVVSRETNPPPFPCLGWGRVGGRLSEAARSAPADSIVGARSGARRR